MGKQTPSLRPDRSRKHSRAWTLYWRDRNLRWHRFEEIPPVRDLAELLPVVDAEPIFYG